MNSLARYLLSIFTTFLFCGNLLALAIDDQRYRIWNDIENWPKQNQNLDLKSERLNLPHELLNAMKNSLYEKGQNIFTGKKLILSKNTDLYLIFLYDSDRSTSASIWTFNHKDGFASQLVLPFISLAKQLNYTHDGKADLADVKITSKPFTYDGDYIGYLPGKNLLKFEAPWGQADPCPERRMWELSVERYYTSGSVDHELVSAKLLFANGITEYVYKSDRRICGVVFPLK